MENEYMLGKLKEKRRQLAKLISFAKKAGKQSICIYIAADKICADDISPTLAEFARALPLLEEFARELKGT
jgi:hypothetical protein